MNVRNELKAQIVRAGMTMQQVVDLLSDEYGWSDSVSNLSAKLQRESIRYKEVLELSDVLGYEIPLGHPMPFRSSGTHTTGRRLSDANSARSPFAL